MEYSVWLYNLGHKGDEGEDLDSSQKINIFKKTVFSTPKEKTKTKKKPPPPRFLF